MGNQPSQKREAERIMATCQCNGILPIGRQCYRKTNREVLVKGGLVVHLCAEHLEIAKAEKQVVEILTGD